LSTFVLVPGGWHGGWAYDRVAAGLRRHGHQALPLTLTGLGDGGAAPSAAPNLDTHIDDVVGVLRETVGDVVLCGHSYGGMVITGAADRLPQRVAGLVYIDAYVPADGDSCWDLTTDRFRRLFVEGAALDGLSVSPPGGLDPRARAHPLASFLRCIRLAGPPATRVRDRDFIYLSGWRDSPFGNTYQRLRKDPGWRTHVLPTGHDVLAEAPDQLVAILIATATA
jgi:pimeloyl-ACP methyl ester carboxylesterase